MSGEIAGLGDLTTLAGWISSIGAFVWGVYTYGDKRTQENKAPFLKQQLDLCFRASDVAATLATESNPEKWDEARFEFWRLYYGTLCIVESRAVGDAMIALAKLVPRPEKPRPAQVPITDAGFRSASIRLAHEARKLILSAWRIKLEPLTDRIP